jgi:hypothetical protein
MQPLHLTHGLNQDTSSKQSFTVPAPFTSFLLPRQLSHSSRSFNHDIITRGSSRNMATRSTRADSSSTGEPTNLMTLPPEIRNKIYEYLFHGTTLRARGGMFGMWKKPHILNKNTSFPSVCKQTYRKTQDLMFSLVTIKLVAFESATLWPIYYPRLRLETAP